MNRQLHTKQGTCGRLLGLSPLSTQQFLAFLGLLYIRQARITLDCHDLLRDSIALHVGASMLRRESILTFASKMRMPAIGHWSNALERVKI